MFGYWVYSVTVDEDQLEFEWQDYDRFKGKFRVDPTQGVYKVKFPVTEARKSAYWTLLNFLQLETSPQQGTNCKESPLMNWLLRNGPK
jgi:hypothetical protein